MQNFEEIKRFLTWKSYFSLKFVIDNELGSIYNFGHTTITLLMHILI